MLLLNLKIILIQIKDLKMLFFLYKKCEDNIKNKYKL